MTTEWALVPVEITVDMEISGVEAMIKNGNRDAAVTDAYACYSAIIAASPGTALLAEVLAARDEYRQACEQGDYSLILLIRHSLLAALDKLGPAAEGAT